MGFTPIAGYSEDRTSTVFTDGNNNQRAEFNFILSTGWTPVSYDENRTSVLLQNGDIKQRATVTYNLGGDGGGGTTGLTVVTHDDTLNGNGTSDSPLQISNSVMTSISQNAEDITTLQNDIGDLGNDVNTNTNDIQNLQNNKQNNLTTEQLKAVNSGITAEHITAYDAYATEISQAQNDATKAETAAEVAQQTANLVGQNLQSVTEKIPAAASSSNLLVDTATMNTKLSTKADSSSLGTMASKDADNYSTTEEANLLYSPIQSSVTDTSSTSITLANANANTVYHYGTLDSLTITAADTSDLETIIWFTPSASLTGITIPDTLQPMNEFSPVAGKLVRLSILNGTIEYRSVL